nr:hypothetical protein [Lachnospiraceae bacterium]
KKKEEEELKKKEEEELRKKEELKKEEELRKKQEAEKVERLKKEEIEREERRRREEAEKRANAPLVELHNTIDFYKDAYPVLTDLVSAKLKNADEINEAVEGIIVYGTQDLKTQQLWTREKPGREQWTEQKLLEVRQMIIDYWGKTHDLKKLSKEERITWEEKGQIPELTGNADSEDLRKLTNSLNDSAYIRKIHKKRQIAEEYYEVSLKHKKNAEAERFRGYMYEAQDRTNDCWSVAGAALINYNLGKKGVTQKNVRAYKPVFRKQYKGEDQRNYEAAKKDIKRFTTENLPENGISSYQGNIFAIADYFREKLGSNIVMKNSVFQIRLCKADDQKNPEKNAVHNITEVFKEKVKAAIQKGQPVAVLRNGHFRVIVSANNNTFTALNSSGNGYTDDFDYESFIEGTAGVIEMTWVEKPKNEADRESITKDYKNLTYSAKKGFQKKGEEEIKDPDKVAISKGKVAQIDVSKTGLSDVRDYYNEHIYLPDRA